MKQTITVSEIFGPVIQGEGPLIGKPTLFVRTGGCDDRCVWCDTPYAVLPQHASTWTEMTIDEVHSQLRALATPPFLVTLSGGNPALQEALGALTASLQLDGYAVACETQGSRPASWFHLLNWLILSPKPPSSGNETMRLSVRKCLTAAGPLQTTGRVALKIVVAGDKDYDYAKRVHQAMPNVKMYLQVCNPHGAESDSDTEGLLASYRWLADRVLTDRWHNVTVLPQLHVLAWGAERGR